MARARSTFGKLQRDQAKRDRARAKQEDRLARREERAAAGPRVADPVSPDDQAPLLDELARLHEDLAEGRISLDEFEVRQESVRERLRVD